MVSPREREKVARVSLENNNDYRARNRASRAARTVARERAKGGFRSRVAPASEIERSEEKEGSERPRGRSSSRYHLAGLAIVNAILIAFTPASSNRTPPINRRLSDDSANIRRSLTNIFTLVGSR